MSKKNKKEEIYNICKEFYNYGIFLNYEHDNTKFDCFLIEKELIDKFKTNIFYDKFKDSIKKNIYFKLIDKNILNKLRKIKKGMVQTKFNNKQELLNELRKGKIFYVITPLLFNNICNEDQKMEIGIEALFHKRKVRLYFKDQKEKVDFKYNEDGTIGKSNIIDKEHDKKYNIKYIKYESQRKIVFKEDLAILIELYYYHKILKSKENKIFKELNDDNKETVYLINNNWIENYKFFFEYKDLENELMSIDSKNLIEIQDIYITDEFIDKKISSLTDSFIEKVNKKNKTNFGKIKYDIMNLQKPNANYLVNNQIVNYGIYDKLNKLNYEGCKDVKKCVCYLIGNQKILLLFEEGVKKDIDGIGYFNNENIFIPEFLLVYDNNDISTKHLNYFFINNFLNFSLNNQINICDILDLNNSQIGQCYKLKNSTENNNSKQISPLKTKYFKEYEGFLKEGNNKNDLSDNNNEKNDIILSIDKFNEELSKKMKDSIRDEYIIKYDECYLIKKDWLDKFKNNYNKFDKNYIKKDSLSDLSLFEYNILYFKDFYIINKKLCENNFISKDENNIPTKFIINN